MKKLLSCLLVIFILVSCISMACLASTGGFVPTETNTGDMSRVPYNNPDLITDWHSGVWGNPYIGDYNGDGYMDIANHLGGASNEGIYVGYGSPTSNEDLILTQGQLVSAKYWASGSFMLFDKDGNWADTWAIDSGYLYRDFASSFWDGQKEQIGNNIVWPKEGDRGEVPYLVDYDGDGYLDYIKVAMDFTEYGWAAKWDSNGVWGDGDDPVHGWIMWAKNIGKSNEQFVFEDNASLICVNNNPDTPVDPFGSNSASFCDMDGDGDLDLLITDFLDEVSYHENKGTRTEPCYAEGVCCRVETESGTDELHYELYYIYTQAFDWNGDGLFDLITGEEDGRISFAENTGKFAQNGAPIFKEPRYFKAPAESLALGCLVTPHSIDWDGDGDEDLFVGDSGGFYSYIENITPKGESTENPSWAEPVRLMRPDGIAHRIISGFNGQGPAEEKGGHGSVQGPTEEKLGYTVFTMADWDGDGDMDLVCNSIWGKIYWLENINKPGEYNAEYGFAPMKDIEVEDETPDKFLNTWWTPKPYELTTQWRTTPNTIDLNKDGLMDIVMLDYQGYCAFFERLQNGRVSTAQKIFKNEDGYPLRLTAAQFGGSGRVKFVFTDWDGDGDLDIVRNDDVSIAWLENVGSAEDPWVYKAQVNLHDRLIVAHTTCPTIVDWNKDGVSDALVGNESGFFYYLINKTPQFTDMTSSVIPENALVAHWDFEGSSPLADKAANGASSDTLTGNANVSNGYASLSGVTLSAADSADLSQSGEMTVVLRMRKDAATETTLLSKGSSYFINLGDNANVIAGAADVDNVNTKGMDLNEWTTVALVLRNGSDGNLTAEVYVNNDVNPKASDFKPYNRFTVAVSANTTNTDALTIGGADFDDVRIYNAALTPAQLAELDLGSPAVTAAEIEELLAALPERGERYTKATYGDLLDTIAVAKEELNSDGNLEAAYKALMVAKNALVEITPTYAELSTFANSLNKNSAVYTTGSYSAFESALASAKAVSSSASQAQITDAYVSLLEASNDLVYNTYTVYFDANGGRCSVTSKQTEGLKISKLPTARMSGAYEFKGWYTESTGGTLITTETEFFADTTVYAHYTFTGEGSNIDSRLYVEGAQIRLPADDGSVSQGIRFRSTIAIDLYSLLSESERPDNVDDTGIGFGTVVLPTQILGDNELRKDTVIIYNGRSFSAKVVPAVVLYDKTSSTVFFNAVMTNVAESNYNTEYTVVPYITYNDPELGEVTLYGTAYSTSIFKVARAAYSDASSTGYVKEYMLNNILSKVDPETYEKDEWTGIFRP